MHLLQGGEVRTGEVKRFRHNCGKRVTHNGAKAGLNPHAGKKRWPELEDAK
jgi:hypothetical protein